MKKLTGIKGFDAITEGGLPENKIVLLSGTPGSGKTIFSLQYLYEGATKYKEPGLYISFEETSDSLKAQAKQFGWDFDKLKNKVKIVHYPIQALSDSSADEIVKLIKDSGAKRFVIDSLSALAFNAPSTTHNNSLTKTSIQKFIYSFVSHLRNNNEAVGFLISQTTKDNSFSNDGVSEFICDGIIHIYYESMGGAFSRSIQVRKMRQIKHDEGVYPLEINQEGIKIHYD